MYTCIHTYKDIPFETFTASAVEDENAEEDNHCKEMARRYHRHCLHDLFIGLFYIGVFWATLVALVDCGLRRERRNEGTHYLRQWHLMPVNPICKTKQVKKKWQRERRGREREEKNRASERKRCIYLYVHLYICVVRLSYAFARFSMCTEGKIPEL